MIIGLAGLKNSGKDTVAAYLVKEHKFERKAFADSLKRSMAALFGISYADIDRFKNDPRVKIQIVRESEYDEDIEIISDYTFRVGAQRYSTESHRRVFDEDFWVEQTLPVQGYYPGRAICVSDVRFKNEAERIKLLGGVVWAVDRDGVVGEDLHESEIIDFPIDQRIDNNGSFEDLYTNIETALSAGESNTSGSI